MTTIGPGKPLVCPYCGSGLDIHLTGIFSGIYGDRRDVTDIECDGKVERVSKLVTE